MSTFHGSEDKAIKNLPGMYFQAIPPSFSLCYASEGAKTLTGYSPQELTASIKLPVHPSDMEAFEKNTNITMLEGLPTESHFTIITKDGEEKRVLMRIRVSATNAEGMPSLFDGFIVDVSKLLLVETAKQANQERTSFFAKMSHEIRTPLNAIIGMAELGLREDIPPIVREYTQSINQAGSKLLSVINDIIDYTKIEKNELKITEEEYNLAQLIDSIITSHSALVKEKNLDFVANIDNKLPNVLVGDAEWLRRIICNLLSNAIKFTDEGFISLSFAGEVEKDSLLLKITVEDTGRGIKEEDQENILKAFTQYDNKNIEGTGLGLSIVDHVVKLMGGTLSIFSSYGQCSSFTVCLAQKIQSGNSLKEAPKVGSKKINFTAPNARVLIVDDIKTNLVVAKGLLAPYKMQMDLCESGAEAIIAVSSNVYNLILMDHMMPVMDGIKTVEVIRALGKGSKTDCKNVP